MSHSIAKASVMRAPRSAPCCGASRTRSQTSCVKPWAASSAPMRSRLLWPCDRKSTGMSTTRAAVSSASASAAIWKRAASGAVTTGCSRVLTGSASGILAKTPSTFLQGFDSCSISGGPVSHAMEWLRRGRPRIGWLAFGQGGARAPPSGGRGGAMRVRGMCGAALVGAMIAASWCVDAGAQTPPAGVSAGVQAQAATLDLSDPKVRERLRAAGIDPDELQKLMNAKAAGAAPGTAPGATAAPAVPPGTAPPANGLPSDATPLAPTQFPPVTPVAGRAPFADSLQTPVAQQPDTARVPLKPFGYELFSLEPATFEPLSFGPVSPDYLIGPGDEIIVSVWGAQELNARAAVNRDGFVVLPDVGQVVANGLTLAQFKDSLEKRLSRIYSGISRDGRGRTSVEVSLGKLRSIQVFVLGDVKQPGGYTLSATSSVMNSLYYAGGPTL